MGYLSYYRGYYYAEINKLESSPPTPENLTHARRLLRLLYDLLDEGYTSLNYAVEGEFHGASRLKEYLKKSGVEPVTLPKFPLIGKIEYSEHELELSEAVTEAMRSARELSSGEALPFCDRLSSFCRWIGYDDNTAYVFLLRNTLLPYVYYSTHGRNRIYPWLISRSSFARLTGKLDADDEIRAPIYNALEAGCTDYSSFLSCALPEIRKVISRYPQAKSTLCSMLSEIDAEKIIIVESGCTGTFPLLLMSLDSRADLRMYTTYPYMADIFKERVFTMNYEENRMFETMVSQDVYFRFSSVRDGRFYVRKCTDAAVELRALEEIKTMMNITE